MLKQAGGFLLLVLFVGYTYQICHNGICHKEMCKEDKDCHASCFMCNTTCATCDPIPNCCTNHKQCDNWDGICDTQDNHPTTCSYCAVDKNCKPGCINNDNCPTGTKCINHECKPDDRCTDDASCNGGQTNVICDIENSPYTTCKYCEGGDCKPGCVTNSNCPADAPTCSNHICQAKEGLILVDSITIRTKTGCTDCSKEGATVFLKGFPTVSHPDGLPCSTNVLDHESSIDYKGGSAIFNGKINGADNEKEKIMMGGCYKGGLNGQLSDGGVLTWVGAEGWEPLDVCVEWVGQEGFAWECEVAKRAGDKKTWNLRDCHNLTPHTSCNRVSP